MSPYKYEMTINIDPIEDDVTVLTNRINLRCGDLLLAAAKLIEIFNDRYAGEDACYSSDSALVLRQLGKLYNLKYKTTIK